MTDDPFLQAEAEVRPYRGLSHRERFRRFLDLMSFMEELMRTRPVEEWRRIWRAQESLDDPGRWWERIPRS
ncbi:MAG: hypothetical protein HYY93_10055 [Planctomycetes bacterium]|nr:hypothetical protein [Planctomycetota bacterium]